MTPIKTARLMRGLSQVSLAQMIGVPPQTLNSYESGLRQLGPKLLPLAADALRVSAAYLRGDAQRLAVYDWASRRTLSCPIVSETVIDDYGMFYLVDVDEVGVVSVIMADGVQFTLGDWQGRQPLTADEIADTDCAWVDSRGADAVVMDGLPRMVW